MGRRKGQREECGFGISWLVEEGAHTRSRVTEIDRSQEIPHRFQFVEDGNQRPSFVLHAKTVEKTGE